MSETVEVPVSELEALLEVSRHPELGPTAWSRAAYPILMRIPPPPWDPSTDAVTTVCEAAETIYNNGEPDCERAGLLLRALHKRGYELVKRGDS